MTEASPVTHLGFLVARTLSAGVDRRRRSRRPTAASWTRTATTLRLGELGELVMRGPQFMLGYWKAPDATDAVLRDGWYWSGDIVRVDEHGLLLRRRSPQGDDQVQGILHRTGRGGERAAGMPSVRDCGVVSRTDDAGEEIPCAFVVIKDGEMRTRKRQRKSRPSSPTG